MQCFFLMEQWILKENSWWAPYLLTLPKPDDIDALCFTDQEEDLAGLKGTNLESAIKKQLDIWRDDYSKGMEQLRKLEWPNAMSGMYTW